MDRRSTAQRTLASRSGPLVMGLDVGTLSTKGVLVDLDGRVIASFSAAHGVRHPRPEWMEHDAEEDWWGDSVRVIRALLQTASVPASRIVGLAASGLFPVLCPASAAGRPLRNAILYADPRAAGEVPRVAEVTAVALKGDETIPKFLWLQEHEPEVAAETRMLFSAPGFVIHRLSGAFAIDFQTAYRFGGLIDRERRSWRGDLCAELGFSPAILPTIHSPLDVVGRVTAEAARQTGLQQGTPVLAGATDTFATLVGNGITARGEAMIYYGTTGLLTVCSHDLETVLAHPHLVDDETPFVLAAYLLNFGEALEGFAEILGQPDEPGGESCYEALEAGAARLPAGSEGLVALPHFVGRVLPIVDPFARGAFFGLSPAHGRYHLWRALLESFGYSIGVSVAALAARGIQLERVVASGGGARSQLWRQIVSDITGLAQEHVTDGDTARGAAFLAARGLGLVENLATMRDAWLAAGQITQPQPAAQAPYARLFDVYQALDESLGGLCRALADATGEPGVGPGA